jgi:diguanylate cyclase (GGDEF)-like protein
MRGKSVLSGIFRLNAAAKLTGSVVINGDYLRLLIVEESENDAESLANILRKAGHSIRFDYAREAEMISSDQRDTLKDFLRSFQSGNSEDSTLSISCVNRDHKNFDSTMEFTPASIGGEPCTQIIIRTNNSNNCELDEKIETMMRQDNLTGLSNRQNFMGLLEENINTRDESGDVRALVYITLDGFRKIREETGIAASDIVLCDVARLLEQQCCGKDILSRFGDFSYAILYHAGSDEKIQATGEKLLQDISGHMSEVNGHPITMTCSIGICAINEYSNDAQMILTHADTACEIARSSGGNRIHTHSPVIDEQTTGAHEMEWDEVIRNIIEEERFYPAYQPIVSLTGDTSKRYEALLGFAREMKKLQCKVALGHCGTGEQSQLLQHVAVDILKIGGKLIASLTENQDYQSRGKEFVTLAHENGRQCIAECVDNPATLAILWQCGVDMMQGNFVQEPSRELAYNFEDEIA